MKNSTGRLVFYSMTSGPKRIAQKLAGFIESTPSLESQWRAIVLFGVNTASYKFALAKTLLELAEKGISEAPVAEIALPFSREIATHLKTAPRQITAPSSKFLDTVQRFNSGEASQDELVTSTVQDGFRYVFDAFHKLPGGDLPHRFFEVTKGKGAKVVITDDLLALTENVQFLNLDNEAEARWKLVETAWQLRMTPGLLVVRYDEQSGGLFVEEQESRRIAVTSCRDALMGYQKGQCFYCFRDVVLERDRSASVEVDHFFPIMLSHFQKDHDRNLNGVWNLVLACETCNRGESGKFAHVPELTYLERLNTRNEFLIESHHPLRETLMTQTGAVQAKRHQFLQTMDFFAVDLLIHRWKPKLEGPPIF